MILLSLGLLAFGVADLIRGPLDQTRASSAKLWPLSRAGLGVACGATAAGAVAALAGSPLGGVVVVIVAAVVVLGIWVAFDRTAVSAPPLVSLGWLVGVLVALFAISSLGDPVEGPLARWYSGLDFSFVAEVPVSQFLLTCAAALFAVASGNRIVVLTLASAAPALTESESRLKGGRFLGPMERVIIGAVILAGDPATAAIVIAAKGLLRFPEIGRGFGRDTEDRGGGDDGGRLGPDENTEYFLIGTTSSLLLASVLALCVSGAG